MSKNSNRKRIQELSRKWMSGTISEKEMQEYDLWYNSFEDHEVYDLTEMELLSEKNKIYQGIAKREGLGKGHNILSIKMRKRTVAMLAACISLFVLFGSYFLYQNNKFSSEQLSSERLYSGIEKGIDQVTLNFEDGTTFGLDSLMVGSVLQEGNVKIEKIANRELIYSLVDVKEKASLMHTVKTPRGRQYKLTLPDGTLVWLNAGSSLRFPTFFNKKDRIVELVGEAYFEVARNESSPFKVITKKESVEVLGTKFNVKSYQDEDVSKTTLLEGRVKVSSKGINAESRILSPGQQSLIRNGEEIEVSLVDPQQAMAWKDGSLSLYNEKVSDVVKQLSRFYGVDIVVSKSLENCIVTIAAKGKDIEQVLSTLALLNNGKLTKVDGTWHITGKGC